MKGRILFRFRTSGARGLSVLNAPVGRREREFYCRGISLKNFAERFANEKLLKADLQRARIHNYNAYGERSVSRVRAKHLHAWESSIAAKQKQSPQWPMRRQRFVRDLDAKLCRLWKQVEAVRRDNCWCFHPDQVW
jgi:hypothetical protein